MLRLPLKTWWGRPVEYRICLTVRSVGLRNTNGAPSDRVGQVHDSTLPGRDALRSRGRGFSCGVVETALYGWTPAKKMVAIFVSLTQRMIVTGMV